MKTNNFNTNTTNNDTWLTPPTLIESLGTFDLDPCSPINRPWDTALKHYTIEDNGLIQQWNGRVWLNPPYGRELKLWLEKMTEHLNGTALIFARTETEALQRYVFPFAESILFIKGRLKFFSDKWEQAQHNANAPSILISYSEYDAEMIERSGIKGYHQYLRQIFVMQFERDHSSDTWKVIVGKALVRLGKENTLREVYQEVISIAPKKVRNNNNYRAKVRQILQQHFKRVAKATYKV